MLLTLVDDIGDGLSAQSVIQGHSHQGEGIAGQLSDGPLQTHSAYDSNQSYIASIE